MPTIQVLSAEVADQIAAGEVVERPSSIVKELVENAIDAGAVHIDVEIEGSGSRLIQVSDDGCGMSREDLTLCVKRHATSKIKAASELIGVSSFGFRGEALPSIASVSRLKIQSRLANTKEGWLLAVDGGKVRDAIPDAWAKGSRCSMRDLFFNTPARAKFLKAPATETQRINQVLSRLALSRHDISFRLKNEKKETLRFHKTETQKQRAAQVLGKTFIDQGIAVETKDGALSLHGWISPPNLHRGNRNGQHLLVNGRWVEHRLFSYHLNRAYMGTLPGGRFCSALLFLKVKDSELDINVHPAKREVRFSDEKSILDFIRRGVRQALQASGFSPAIAMNSQRAPLIPNEALKVSDGPALNGLDISSAVSAAPNPSQKTSTWTTPPKKEETDFPAPLAQLHKSYILCQNTQGLLLVDQHAAHERVNFEKILKAVRSKGLERQNLLLPQKLSLGPNEADRLRRWLPSLAPMGLDLNDMGGGDFYVNAIPPLLKNIQVSALIQDLLDSNDEEVRDDPESPFIQNVAANIACKASVKANHSLKMEEMRALIKDLFQCDIPWDPHGRPAMVTVTLNELEKHFHR